MVYGEYAMSYPGDNEFFDFVSGVNTREINFLHRVFYGDGGIVLDLMSVPMSAVRDAPPARTGFP